MLVSQAAGRGRTRAAMAPAGAGGPEAWQPQPGQAQCGFCSYAVILRRATERAHAREGDDYTRAGTVCQELVEQGVRLDDTNRCFVTASGHTSWNKSFTRCR